MIRSLRRFEPTAPVWALCLDDKAYELMSHLAEAGVNLIKLAELERGDADLLAARNNRSLIEYYFTCTPSLTRFLLNRVPSGDYVTYIDSDLYFFSDPNVLYKELGEGSVTLISHRFAEHLKDRERYGIYNVGWMTFKKSDAGMTVVEWWRNRCNEWCYDRLEPDRFADQKYLEQFSKISSGVVVIGNEGANAAPWNIARYEIRRMDSGVYLSQTTPLVFFHFHGLKIVGNRVYIAGLKQYDTTLTRALRKDVYRPYITHMIATTKELEKIGAYATNVLVRGGAVEVSRWRAHFHRARAAIGALLRSDALLVWRARAF